MDYSMHLVSMDMVILKKAITEEKILSKDDAEEEEDQRSEPNLAFAQQQVRLYDWLDSQHWKTLLVEKYY